MRDDKSDSFFRKVWYFIWKDDSLLSWIVNIILAFIIVKFLIYPGLGLLFGTSYPVVAVVSGSMEHQGFDFDDWWTLNKDQYRQFNISRENFQDYRFKNGFKKGDLMIITRYSKIKSGDVIVFRGAKGEPIIHRVVIADENIFIQTKGDNNSGSRSDEVGISENNIIGLARLRIPYLGWFKLVFLELFGGVD